MTPPAGAPGGWSTADLLRLARRDAASQGRAVQTEFGFWDNVQGFYHAVDWSRDRWIFLFAALQLCALASVVCVRDGSAQMQGTVFLLWVGVSLCASPLNAWGNANWRLFSTQYYFDKNGVFMSALFTAPLILVLLVQLVLIVRHLSSLAVAAGKLKVKSLAREKKRGNKDRSRKSERGGAEQLKKTSTDSKKKTS